MKKYFYYALLTFLFSNLNAQNKSNKILIPYRDGNLWGYCDTIGRVIVKPYYEELIDFKYDSFQYNLARFVSKKNGKTFVTDQKSELILAPTEEYDSVKIDRYETKLIELYSKNKKGFCFNEKEKSLPLYDDISSDVEGRIIVKKGNKVGIVNSQNQIIVPIDYVQLYRDDKYDDINKNIFKFKWFFLNDEGKTGLIDDEIKLVNLNEEKRIIYDKIIMDSDTRGDDEVSFTEELALSSNYNKIEKIKYTNYIIVYKNNKVGVYDSSIKNLIIDVVFDSIECISERNVYFKVKNNSETFILNNESKKVTDISFDDFYYDRNISNYVYIKSGKKGIYFFDNYYKLIEAKYTEIIEKKSIPISNKWNFSIFKVKDSNGRIGFVGENGVEYFKN